MAGELNPYRLSQILGGVVVPGGQTRFGNFGLLRTTGEMLAERPPMMADIEFSDSDDDVIRKAFERLRDGLAVDRFLADPQLTARFNDLCRKWGLRQPPEAINRRLLARRKAAGGGRLEPSTRRESHRGLRDRFGPGVELALVRLSIRHGATVDDVLADPRLGREFERIARSVSPGGAPLEYRLSALQIRKSRHIGRAERKLFDSIDVSDVEAILEPVGGVAEVEPADFPKEPGILVLSEPGTPLVASVFADARAGAEVLVKPSFLTALGREAEFWRPDPAQTVVSLAAESSLPHGDLDVWYLRVLHDLHPVFNLPVGAA
jgi:hypothetical protein